MVGIRFDREPDFITEEERQKLVDWFEESLLCGKRGGEITAETKGYVSVAPGSPVEFVEALPYYPDTAYEIFQRIREKYDLLDAPIPEKTGVIRDGMVPIASFPGGELKEHLDKDGAITFNVLIQAPDEGGVTTIGGEEHPVKERELHAYAACEHLHHVSPVVGETNRYMWVFRLIAPNDKWESYDL